MKQSSQIGHAYNLFRGTVTQVDMSGEHPEVTIEIAPGIEITSMVTRTDAWQLRQVIGTRATALVETVDVMLVVE